MLDGKVSVIIPTRNRLSVVRAVKSVLAQDYSDIEVIVVDDGSSDEYDILEILAEFKNEERVKICGYKSVKGSAFARNYGVEFATGEFVTFLDSDDAFLLNCISTHMHTHGDLSDRTITYGQGVRSIFSGDDLKSELSIEPSNCKHPRQTCASYLFKDNGRMFTPTLFLKREFFNQIKFNNNLLRHVDYGFVIDAEANGAEFFFIEKPLFYWISSVDDEGSKVKGINIENSLKFLNVYAAKISKNDLYYFMKNKLTEVAILSREFSLFYVTIGKMNLSLFSYISLTFHLVLKVNEMFWRKLSKLFKQSL